MRHHTMERFEALFEDFLTIEAEDIEVATMRGQNADARQFFLQKPVV